MVIEGVSVEMPLLGIHRKPSSIGHEPAHSPHQQTSKACDLSVSAALHVSCAAHMPTTVPHISAHLHMPCAAHLDTESMQASTESSVSKTASNGHMLQLFAA